MHHHLVEVDKAQTHYQEGKPAQICQEANLILNVCTSGKKREKKLQNNVLIKNWG